MSQWQYRIHVDAIEFLEDAIDHFEQEIPDIREFIIPGGNQPSSILHVCRTVARRAERRTITLIRQEAVASAEVLRFLNRLSDLLFILARTCNVRDEINDVMYQHKKL